MNNSLNKKIAGLTILLILICSGVLVIGLNTLKSGKVDDPVSLLKLKEMSGYDKVNLFEGISSKDGYYIEASTGKQIKLKGYSATDYFEVSSGVYYDLPFFSDGSQIAFYDSDYKYLSGFKTDTNRFYVPDDQRIAFARWCAETESKHLWELYIEPVTAGRTCYIDENTGLLNGLIDAYGKGADKVIVLPGNYDIISEYEAYYGSDYFDNYADNYNNEKNGIYDCGVPIDNIDIKFESGAVVKANYTGNNKNVKKYFSAFAVVQNATIDGLVLDSSELRYGIHVDYHRGETETLLIKNCDLHHFKNSDNSVHNNQAIGAGLGVHSTWTIENCIFRSDTDHPVLKIHNNLSENAISKIYIKDCYIIGKGYFLLNSFSSSVNETCAVVTGCSWENPVAVGKESPEANDNIIIYEWNNETRDN